MSYMWCTKNFRQKCIVKKSKTDWIKKNNPSIKNPHFFEGPNKNATKNNHRVNFFKSCAQRYILDDWTLINHLNSNQQYLLNSLSKLSKVFSLKGQKLTEQPPQAYILRHFLYPLDHRVFNSRLET